MEPPATSVPPARRNPGRNLPAAVAVGVTLAAIFLGTVFWNPYAFLTFVALLIAVGLLELDQAFRGQDLRPATPVAVVAGLVMLYGSYRGGAPMQALGLVILVGGTVLWTLLDTRRKHAAVSIGATVLAALWVPFLASYLGLLLARPEGHWYVVMAIALPVANDIGAYATGVRLGRHKLAPSVSPGKTWEGFAGGLLGTVAIAALVATQVVPGVEVVPAIVIAVGVSLAATVGDLAESLVKRVLGLKDLGTFLPGHGGVMDRVDAILFALPASHFLLAAFGL